MPRGQPMIFASDILEARIATLQAKLKEAKARDALLDDLYKFVKKHKYEASDVRAVARRIDKENEAVKGPKPVKSRKALHPPATATGGPKPTDVLSAKELEAIKAHWALVRRAQAAGKSPATVTKPPAAQIALAKYWKERSRLKRLRKAAQR